jgi:thymidylate kinase
MSLYCLEGVDGVGKSTIMKLTAQRLIDLGVDNFLLTKEPGGPLSLKAEWKLEDDDILCKHLGYQYETGPQVRDFCVNHPGIPQLAKRALFKADSFCNWEYIVKPAIQSDEFVISDRCWVSDLVYGSVLSKLDPHALFQFNMSLIPQLHGITNVICLTAPEKVREERLSTNIADENDKLGPVIRNELAKAYTTIIKDYVKIDQQWFIDSNRSIDKVVEDVVDIITGDY